ncbi:glycoside hydrolase family 95 protein [Catenovulum sp. 2E275]|uniref:glycoside hydrolase family 95 protein n=1 Tax=Catenovulum sp. 2E275 TaxID=2980497 RepID=UPI0021D06FB0|nr:glycoside hydrolase family 95 protein [Catenovulum sp. 2E275]MCU4676926.1 glycoside hydrolase family 95 protein [Catenovulum sp. 2E275]
MQLFSRLVLIAFVSFFMMLAKAYAKQDINPNSQLWYDQPATQWVEALPIGNGRLGAMVFGGIGMEQIQLNEDTLWAGGPYNPANPNAKKSLSKIRTLIANGELSAAQALVDKDFMSQPLKQMQYQTIGSLLINMAASEQAENYIRELDLETAITKTSFNLGDVLYTREAFVSPVDQVIAIKLTAKHLTRTDKQGLLSFNLAFQSPLPAQAKSLNDNTLILAGTNTASRGVPAALNFETRVKVRLLTGQGEVKSSGQQLHITAANEVLILISSATSYKNYQDVSGDPVVFNTRQLNQIANKSYNQLKQDAVNAHKTLFSRSSLDLGVSQQSFLPTNKRIAQFSNGQDPALAALYYAYGRYLLLSSSRPGTQPANLQGIWNDSIDPPWGSKYTININTEMNYWLAEPSGLSETTEPLVRLIKEIAQTGAKMAQQQYGSNGWVTHHNTDLWRATGPIDAAFYGMWPMGGAWLSTHLWEHYAYTGDKDFLQDIYPILKGASIFFIDNLIEDKSDGTLVTSPSMSPENAHHDNISIAQGPAIDNQILRDLFAQTATVGQILGQDSDFQQKLMQIRARLPKDKIGKQGQLQEWKADWDEFAKDQQHRHVSHLYALHPSAQISPRKTPELAQAAKVTLNKRGDITTGWAIAWRINLWARLLDAERAYSILELLISPQRSYPNLFDAHPPFQIDGNLGGANAIIEMLLQSHQPLNMEQAAPENLAYLIELLPALPVAWATGKITGLRARGGFVIDLEWQNHNLTQAKIHSLLGTKTQLKWAGKTLDLNLKAGESYIWQPSI